MMKFDGNKMKLLREKAGLSQSGLAEKMGKQQSTIALWENGGYAPKVANSLKIAIALGVNMGDLYSQEEEEAAK